MRKVFALGATLAALVAFPGVASASTDYEITQSNSAYVEQEGFLNQSSVQQQNNLCIECEDVSQGGNQRSDQRQDVDIRVDVDVRKNHNGNDKKRNNGKKKY